MKNSIFIFLALVLCMFSCEKEKLTVDTPQVFTFLTFDDAKALSKSIKAAQSEEFAASIKQQFPKFVSYNDVYYQAQEDIINEIDVKGRDLTAAQVATEFPVFVGADGTGEEEVLPLIKSYTMRKLLDQNRVIVVGDKAYQYGFDKVFIAPVQGVTNFTDLSEANGVVVESFENYTNRFDKGLEGLCDDEYRHDGRRHRLKPRWFSEVFSIGGTPFKDVWIEIKHQKKSTFWFANEEDEIRCSGTMRIFNTVGGSITVANVNASRTNTSILERTVQNDEPTDLTGNLPNEWVMTNSSVFHESFDSGTNPGCRISK